MEVYLVTGPGGKKYVGIVYGRKQTVVGRWREHCSPRAATKHLRLERAIRKHGAASFEIRVIDTAQTIEELKQKESYYILLHNAHRSGYNGTTGDSFAASQQALHLSRQRPEYRKLRADLIRGNKNPMANPKHRAAMLLALAAPEVRLRKYAALLQTLRAKPEWINRHAHQLNDPEWLSTRGLCSLWPRGRQAAPLPPHENAMRRPEVKALARKRRVDKQEAERRARIDQLFMERWANLRWL